MTNAPALRRQLSVVIPTYNRCGMLPDVLRPLLADPASTEVIVVVDGCHDGSWELLTDWAHREPRLRPIFQENAGQAAARQAGVEAAHGEIVVILDDDVIAEPGLIGKHADWHTDGESRLVLGYSATHPPLPRRPGQAPTILYAEDHDQICAKYESDPRYVLTNLWAGNMSLRRDDALRVGLDNDRHLRYHEDQLFGFRCERAGLTPVFDRLLAATHSHSRSVAKFASECRIQGNARVKLTAEYPDLAPNIDASLELPTPTRLIVFALSAPLVAASSSLLLRAAAFVTGQAHRWALETVAVRLLRQVELRRGIRTASR